MSRRVFHLCTAAVVIWLSLGAAFAQEAKHNGRPAAARTPTRQSDDRPASETARYTFEFEQSRFVISHIVIEHDASGRGKITFQHKDEESPIVEPIELSPAARERIFALWKSLRFLDSDEKYQSAKNFSHLGTYRLEMAEGQRRRKAEFNWSNNADAWTLAQEYRRAADQAIFVFDITVARENQPLNAPGLLNQLESMYKRNALSDPKQLVPLLKELRADEHLPLIARNQADRLVKKFEK